jgi:hypothetical protein
LETSQTVAVAAVAAVAAEVEAAVVVVVVVVVAAGVEAQRAHANHWMRLYWASWLSTSKRMDMRTALSTEIAISAVALALVVVARTRLGCV